MPIVCEGCDSTPRQIPYQNSRRLIGLTGLYCSGKNHIARLLEQRGIPVLDVDKQGHIALENKKAAVFSRFGDDIKNPDGSVNRRLLGAKVFGHAEDMAALESIVHPEANRLTLEWIAAQNGKSCVINAAVLHKSAVFTELDCVVLVKAPLLVRLARAKRRDRLSWTTLIRRLISQRHFSIHYLAGNADIYRVENPGFARTSLENQIDTILSKLGLENRTI